MSMSQIMKIFYI